MVTLKWKKILIPIITEILKIMKFLDKNQNLKKTTNKEKGNQKNIIKMKL